MPLVHIALRKGKPDTYRQAIAEGVHEAIVATIKVPQDDRFQIITELEAGRLIADPAYLGIRRTEDVVIIELTMAAGRTKEQKQALYRRIASNLSARPGVRPEDVMVVIRENELVDWSFGNGEAQFASRSFSEVRG